MNELLLDKIDELIFELENSSEIKEMKLLKDKIYKDEELEKLLNKYRSLNNYTPTVKDIKRQIIENDLVVKYRFLENELYFTVLEMNNKLNTLIDKKRCS